MKSMFFEVRQTGDENAPWMVWDRDEQMPYSYHADVTGACEMMARLRWAEEHPMARRATGWPV